MEIANALGMRLIPNIEFDCGFEKKEFHMLGINMDHENNRLLNELRAIEKIRYMRAIAIVEKIEGKNFKVNRDVLKKDQGSITRLDIATAVINSRMSPVEFFARHLAKGKDCYVERVKTPVEKAIRIIHLAGGKAVWAHPAFTLLESNDEKSLLPLAKKFSSLSLDGLEVFYGKNSENETRRTFEAAEQLGLLMSPGSDFHRLKDKCCFPGSQKTYGLKFDPKKIVKDFTE